MSELTDLYARLLMARNGRGDGMEPPSLDALDQTFQKGVATYDGSLVSNR